MPRIYTPGRQHFDRNGNPLSNGQLYTRETDGVTDKAVYPTEADATAGSNALANPVVLDSEGREPELWGSGDYWMNLEDEDGVQIDTWPKSPVSVDATINTPDLFYGLTLSNNSTDSDHDIDIAVGACMDSTGAVRINLSTAFTKQIDATWAAGTDVGGLASGATLAVNTWYHVFAVVVGGSSDVMFDTSATCANGVANNAVTSYQYINSVLTDSSSNILAFENLYNHVWFYAPELSVQANNPGATTQTVTLDSPLGIRVLAEIGVVVDQGASGMGDILIGATNQLATASSAQADIGASLSQTDSINKKVLTDTSSQIQYECVTGTDGSILIWTKGWEILR